MTNPTLTNALKTIEEALEIGKKAYTARYGHAKNGNLTKIKQAIILCTVLREAVPADFVKRYDMGDNKAAWEAARLVLEITAGDETVQSIEQYRQTRDMRRYTELEPLIRKLIAAAPDLGEDESFEVSQNIGADFINLVLDTIAEAAAVLEK